MRETLKYSTIVILFILLVSPVFSVDKPRNIMLLFDLKEYDKEIESTIDYFFTRTLRPGDQLMVMTPANKIYSYSSRTLYESRHKVIGEIKNSLKKHTSVTSSDYMNIYNRMLNIVDEIREGSGLEDVKNLIAAYENIRQELRRTRRVNESLLLQFSDVFKRSRSITGDTDNRIYFFFQREVRPVPDQNTMSRIRENIELSFKAAEVFLKERSQLDIDAELIADELKEAEVTFNFIYITPKDFPTQRFQLLDNSGDFYNAMSVIAERTGGKTITTTRPRAIFELK